MSIDFKAADFFHPLSILRLRSFFDRSQWFTPEKLADYQRQRLKLIVDHAYRTVPFYRDLFDRLSLRPRDIAGPEDLPKLPVLTKAVLRAEFERFKSNDARRHRPQLVHTSGTSGQQLFFLVDKHANVLEFVNYWRYWGWGGYRLGDRFAEFSDEHFLKSADPSKPQVSFQRLPGRLILNSVAMSPENAVYYAEVIRRYRPRFVKGLPSILYYFALFLQRRGIRDIRFRSAFCCGEVLLDHQKRLIGEVLGCRVFNAYGVMERVATISECGRGGMHINSEYGILEITEKQAVLPQAGHAAGAPRLVRGKIVGTSMYNMAMPLLRYDTGDAVEIDENAPACPCGRGLPTVRAIEGRLCDAVRTPDGRVLTALYEVFSYVGGIQQGQIIQESADGLLVRVVPGASYTAGTEAELTAWLRGCTGPVMRVRVERVSENELADPLKGKFKSVISRLGSTVK